MSATDLAAGAEHEVRALHDFFVAWLTGRAPAGDLDRLTSALHPDCVRIAPDGAVQDRDAIVAMLAGAHGALGPEFPDRHRPGSDRAAGRRHRAGALRRTSVIGRRDNRTARHRDLRCQSHVAGRRGVALAAGDLDRPNQGLRQLGRKRGELA